MEIPAARSRVLEMVDIMMRVPPIIVIDELLRTGIGLQFYHDDDLALSATSITLGSANGTFAAAEAASLRSANASNTPYVASMQFYNIFGRLSITADGLADLLGLATLRFASAIFVFIAAFMVFLLSRKRLVLVYMFLASIGLIALSHVATEKALQLLQRQHLLDTLFTGQLHVDHALLVLAFCLAAQWMFGALFAYLHVGPRVPVLQRNMSLFFAAPILLAILPWPAPMLECLPLLVTGLCLALSTWGVCSNLTRMQEATLERLEYVNNFISDYGIAPLIENEWMRLNVPKVLRVFWTVRLFERVYSIWLHNSLDSLNFYGIFQKLLVDSAETMTSVLGMTSIVSVICDTIGRSFQSFLLIYENDEEKSLGTVSAVLFYILALQTGLTTLSPQKRFVRLCRNFCLLGTALLHFLHNIVSPVLMSLSAARNPSRRRHVRALGVCALLTIIPIYMLKVLWRDYSASTWLLAVTAFSIEVIVKVLVTLATYTLFIMDAHSDCFWEKLDDYLYYVRAVGNSIEFVFGILLFVNGSWILLFESGGAIRAIMMCIHAYFNIWCEAHSGWEVFIKRRTAVNKMSALPEATAAELENFEDVCAICYQEMHSAKITRCNHYFHSVCLRKWLYVQDSCPLCQHIMVPSAAVQPTHVNINNERPARARLARDHTQARRRTSSTTNNTETAPSSATALATAAASNSLNTIGLQTDTGPMA